MNSKTICLVGFNSLLTQQYQLLKINSYLSDAVPIKKDAPLIFLVYINFISGFFGITKPVLYPDDLNLVNHFLFMN